MNKKIIKCDQKQCCYYEVGSGCPICAECDTKSNFVNDDCVSCWNCLKDEGILRNEPELPDGVIQIQINQNDFEDISDKEVISIEVKE